MKREKLFVVFVLMMCGLMSVNSVKADGSPTDNVTVNLKFRPVQSITVAASQETVDLIYATEANYQNGVSATLADHLTVFSTGGVAVSVKADTENFTSTSTGAVGIPVGDVVISAANGTGNSVSATLTDVPLATTNDTLIASEDGGRDLKFNVTYDNTVAGSSDSYINKYIHPDNPETVYTTTVTYTIVTK